MSFMCVVGHWSLSKPSALSLKEAAIKKVLSLRKCAKINTFWDEVWICRHEDREGGQGIVDYNQYLFIVLIIYFV